MSTSTVTVFVVLLIALAPADAAPVAPAQVLVRKVLQSLTLIHAQTVTAPGLTFDPSGHAPGLTLMMLQLQIPPTPVLKPLDPPTYTQSDLLTAMWEGLQKQQRIVGALSSRLSVLRDLSVDLQDLQVQVTAMMSSLDVAVPAQADQSDESGLLSRIHGDYEAQVAAHLTLTTLRDFCQDLHRGLRSLQTNHSATGG